MIYKDSQSSKSLLDFLVQIMPDWRDQVVEFRKSPRYLATGKAAKTLFSLWRDENNKIKNDVLRRPVDVSLEDVKAMQQAGLVRDLGDKVEITGKGKDVIKTMILGDDKSIYEDDGKTLPYEIAYANCKKRPKTAKKIAASPELHRAADIFHYALRLQLKQCTWADVPDNIVDDVKQAMQRTQDRENWYRKLKNAGNDNSACDTNES